MDNYPPTNGLAATIHLDDVLSDDDSGEFDVFRLPMLLERNADDNGKRKDLVAGEAGCMASQPNAVQPPFLTLASRSET
jgi:hypothetical protein